MIDFSEPMEFTEALNKLGAKHLLPTNLSSAEIRSQWSAALRDRSLFSARTTKAEILQRYKDQLGALLDGKTNVATARAKIQDLFKELGYTPEQGFQGEEGLIEPAEAGSIRDLASSGRIDLVLQTNMRQAANFAFRESGQTDFALYAWPCYEFLRIYPRNVPRGFKETKHGLEEVPGEDWPSRWEECGGEFFDGRMIARKDSDIWDALGSEFDDSLDSDVPPFAFNSGFGWTEISREEAIELGVIEVDTDIQGSEASMNEGMATAARFDPEFLKALSADLDTEIADAKLRLITNDGRWDPGLHPKGAGGRFVFAGGGKRGNKRKANEQKRQPQEDTTRSGASEGHLESAARYTGRGLERSPGHDAGGSERAQRVRAEEERLEQWAREHGKLGGELPTTHFTGGEHTVEMAPERGLVIKATEPRAYRGYGVALGRHGGGATPSEYLDRQVVANRMFNDKVELERVVPTRGKLSIVTSQPLFRGKGATVPQVDALMHDKGFKKIAEGTYYHRGEGLLVGDLEPHPVTGLVRNARVSGGVVHPFDASIQRVTPKFAAAIKANPNLRHVWL